MKFPDPMARVSAQAAVKPRLHQTPPSALPKHSVARLLVSRQVVTVLSSALRVVSQASASACVGAATGTSGVDFARCSPTPTLSHAALPRSARSMVRGQMQTSGARTGSNASPHGSCYRPFRSTSSRRSRSRCLAKKSACAQRPRSCTSSWTPSRVKTSARSSTPIMPRR